jgi:hypothetical protein
VSAEHSLVIRDGACVAVATMFLRGAGPVRIVAREVSSRLGQRAPAQCLELPLDASLEALTIIVPTAVDGTIVSFAVDVHYPERGVSWTDATGRHRVITGVVQTPPLPERQEKLNDGLTWWIESLDAADHDHHGALIAALPTPVLAAPCDAQAIGHLANQSGRMAVLANTRGRWQQLDVEEPRRG